MPTTSLHTTSPWPRRLAWALVVVTFALVAWGGVVTATGSGMAFRDWITSDGVFMPLYPWLQSTGSKFIEHGHRLLGMAAGVLSMALVASAWLGGASQTVRRLSLVLLAGVIAQGILGGMRVVLDERVLALLHGCVGPLFFAAAAAMVALTAKPQATPIPGNNRLTRLAIVTAALAYLQLVLGAIVRHAPLMTNDSAAALFQTAVYFHVLMAIVVTVHVLLLAAKCLRTRASVPAACGLATLILLQVALGLSSWMVKYGIPPWATRLIGETGHFNRASDAASAAIVAGHGAVGALLVAICTAIAVHAAQRSGRFGRAEAPLAAPREAIA